jgi:hypothetical protein
MFWTTSKKMVQNAVAIKENCWNSLCYVKRTESFSFPFTFVVIDWGMKGTSRKGWGRHPISRVWCAGQFYFVGVG